MTELDARSVQVRPARAADCQAAAVLLHELGYDRDPHDLIQALDRSPGDHVLVAELGRNIVGLVALRIQHQFHIDTPVAAIDALIVQPRHRNATIGAALLDAATDIARTAGAGFIELHSNQQRHDAHRFYQRHGFEITSNYFRRDLVSDDHNGTRRDRHAASQDASTLTRVLVPELSVAALDRTLAFYVDTLGFTIRFTRPDDGFAYLTLDDAPLMVEQRHPHNRLLHDAEPTKPPGWGVHLQLRVRDIDTCYRSCQHSNCAIVAPLEDRWYRVGATTVGNRQFVVADPDGYLIRPYQDLGTRPQPDPA